MIDFLKYYKAQLLRYKKKQRILFAAVSVGMLLIGLSGGWMINEYIFHANKPQVQGEQTVKTYPLLRYAFSNLMTRPAIATPLEISRIAKTEKDFTAYVFTYTSEGKKVSGMMNVPNVVNATESGLPVIVMLRGYVDPQEYEIGKGTQHIAEKFVKKGYITIAPDFLSFGESDPEPEGLFEGRFIKPVTVIDLLSSIEQTAENTLIYNKKSIAKLDATKLGLWGHSNGGQISISVLEITGREIPTSLWAPVTKQFPYSVLFFTDEYEDQGKALRATVAEFESDYDINDFTIGKFLDNIKAKIYLHQGTVDDAVPKEWSDDFYSLMVGKGKKDQIEYAVYENADHGLYPYIDEIVEKDIKFYDRELKVKRDFSDLISVD